MSVLIINIGTSPNSNTGDNLRDAFSKANTNFINIDANLSTKLANTNGTTYQGNLTFTNNITVGNTVFAAHFDNVSDLSLKENINPILYPVDLLMNLNPVSFTWKKDGSHSYGLIAQEVECIIPSLVREMENGTKAVNYVEIVSILIGAIKTLKYEIDELKKGR